MKSLVRDRRKDILKLLAALRLRDAYAMRKLVRRLALPVLVFAVVAAAASPAWAKKVTDEELMAFLNSPAAPAAASKPADTRPAAASVTTAVIRTDEEPQALKEDEQVEKSSVTGVVSAIGKQGIAVEYSQSKSGSQEMYLPFTRPVKLGNIASLDLLQAGDKVRVEFERVYKERPLKDAKGKDRDKKEKIILRTTVTVVQFMSRPPADTLKSMEDEA